MEGEEGREGNRAGGGRTGEGRGGNERIKREEEEKGEMWERQERKEGIPLLLAVLPSVLSVRRTFWVWARALCSVYGPYFSSKQM